MDMAALRRGRRGAVARAISTIENDPRGARALIKKIFAETGGSAVVGITGPAGAGKSSLIDRLVMSLKKLGANPAVLAVDPSSRVSGGAILGDRVRMSESTDSGAFIRSIASRGARGAVSHSLRNCIRVLEYARFDPVLVESVGAGQTETDISDIADVTVVVFNPNTGDSIQAIKAGLTEIGDIYVVNKSDLAGAGRLYDAVRDFIGGTDGLPVALKTSAKRNTGTAALARKIMEVARSRDPGTRAAGRLRAELRDIILSDVGRRVDMMLQGDKTVQQCVEKMLSKKMDPYQAGERIARMMAG